MTKRSGMIAALVAVLATAAAAASQDGRPFTRVAREARVPAPPQEFAAPPNDRAGRVAREIARIVPRFANLRAMHRHGQWRHEESARWSIRSERECLDDLARLGIEARHFVTSTTPIPTPIRLQSPIGGVRYRMRWNTENFIISCELAARLPHLSEIVSRYGANEVEVSSTWRRTPPESFHRMGMALDIVAFHGAPESLVVLRDFRPDPHHATCPPPEGAPALQRMACEIGDGGRFSTVITPSYSAGHRNHFHLDVRPDDPRVFVR